LCCFVQGYNETVASVVQSERRRCVIRVECKGGN